MRAALESALEPHAARAVKAEVCVADAAERALVEEYELSRAPMPLVLALAPNGAITGGFTENGTSTRSSPGAPGEWNATASPN